MLNDATLTWATVAQDSKAEALFRILNEMESVVVGFSGGVDSSLLAAAAHHALGERALMVTALSETFPRRDAEQAERLVRKHGWRHRSIRTTELTDERFAMNPPDRCFFCKSELFGRLKCIAREEGLRWVADGSNVDDLGDYRPGARAKAACGVRSPMQEAGFTKEDVRALSRAIGLETADLPASACLASRLPYGARITPEALAAVERAETALRELGFGQARVRSHGEIARIEVTPDDLALAVAPDTRTRLADAVKASGFRFVTLDLEGYRMGSMNETLSPEQKQAGQTGHAAGEKPDAD